MGERMSKEIIDLFQNNNLNITEEQSEKLDVYYKLLVEWNEKINLTAITEYEEIIRKHFLDSALLITSSSFSVDSKCRILDLGTGAGFPGIVLALLCPQFEFVLIDSLNKRIAFLEIVVKELELSNVKLYHGRAEDFGRNEEFRSKFDFVVSRAVAELPILMEYCIPFVKVGGLFVSYKGSKYKDELSLCNHALEELSSVVDHIENISLNHMENRYFVFIKKIDETKEKYPRKAGKAKKSPL